MPIGHITTLNTPPVTFATFQDKTQWQWIVGDQAPDEDTFGEDGQAIGNIQGYVFNHTMLQSFLTFFKGYSYVDYKNPLLPLRRNMPSYHPRWPYLRCTNVQIKGVKFDGQELQPAPWFYTDSLPLPIYEKYRFSVHYEGLPYDVRSDGAVADLGNQSEWSRFLTIDPVDEVEIITQEGGFYKYVSTTTPPNGTQYLGPALQVRAERTGLMVTAYGIASDFLLNQFNIPIKFVQAKSLVNNATFLGFGPERVILSGFKITKKPQYIATQDSTSGTGLLLYGCKVEMHFTHTDPKATDGLVDPNAHYGWNLCPGPGGVGWGYVRTDPTVLGMTILKRNLYSSCDFNALLTHWSLNDLNVTP